MLIIPGVGTSYLAVGGHCHRERDGIPGYH